MNVATSQETENEVAVTQVDVLIIGAGISGIGSARHLMKNCPGKRFALLETQDSFGGTWRSHTYPGLRSDSDLFTFGYQWKPWKGAPIAKAGEILSYLDETLHDLDIEKHIRFQHKVMNASWSSTDKLWTLDVNQLDTGKTVRFTTNFLWMCQGYYRHFEGYTPQWPSMNEYQGQIAHPETWPEDLDYAGKRVLVIGSGATAATIIPAMADECDHITMLQRSPTYFAAAPNANETTEMLRELDVPEEWTHEITRRKILHDQRVINNRSFNDAEALKQELIDAAKTYLPEGFDVEKHFTPKYRPWQQRLAFLPDGDLFQGIAQGKASVVTDQIEKFTAQGVLLKSGKELEADIIITATGFNLCVLGDIAFEIDGQPLDFHDSVTWRGILYSGIPNMAWVFGYLRTSWTMRADLIGDFVCRLLNHMDDKGAESVTPQLREDESNMTLGPFVDADNFNAGYLTRNMHLLPQQGGHQPWLFTQDYYQDVEDIPGADLDDGSLVYD